MEYYIVIKRNDILIHVTIYINLETIMLNERRVPKKSPLYMITFKANNQYS